MQLCRRLLGAGAEVDAVTTAGQATPLHRACIAGRLEVARLLLAHGANPNLADGDGETPLHKVKNGLMCDVAWSFFQWEYHHIFFVQAAQSGNREVYAAIEAAISAESTSLQNRRGATAADLLHP